MVTPHPSYINIANLKFIYCESNFVNQDALDLDNLNPETDLLGANYPAKDERKIKFETYFNQLHEQITDQLEVIRQIQKNYIVRPPTISKSLFEFGIGLLGMCAPVVGAVGHAVHNHVLPFIEHGIHLTVHAIESLHNGEHSYHAVHHSSNPVGSYKIGRGLVGKDLPYFIDKVVAQLTYDFRYEIMSLTEGEINELAIRHFYQIVDCFTSIKDKKTCTAELLFRRIMESINPDPLVEVEKLITSYKEKRKARVFKSISDEKVAPTGEAVEAKREKYLSEFSARLHNESLPQLIFEISENLRFKDYKLSGSVVRTLKDENAMLSLEHPFFKHLVIDPYPIARGIHEFKNAYAFAVLYNCKFKNVFSDLYYPEDIGFTNYVAMKSVAEKIVLLLLRSFLLSITNLPDNTDINEENKRMIFDLTSPTTKELHKAIRKLDDVEEHVDNLQGVVDNLQGTEQELKVEVDNLRTTTAKSEENIEELQKKTVKHKEKRTILKDQIEDQNKKIEDQSKKIDDQSKKIDELTTSVDELKKNLETTSRKGKKGRKTSKSKRRGKTR